MLCDMVLAFISVYVASRVPLGIDFLHCIYNRNHRREEKEKEQNREKERGSRQKEKESSEEMGGDQLNEPGREPKWESEKERDVEL